jgi:hypothetical protein
VRYKIMIVFGVTGIWLVGRGALMIHPGLLWIWLGLVCWKVADAIAASKK